MLIRKSLHGNLRPTPGDLYDPRDGSCLPNFHLSTTHNPNLQYIVQDLVKYDIQLVREMPSSKVSQKQQIGPNNPWTESHSLMLLAVAEYAESLPEGHQNTHPFVIHKVFYREAVAGILHLRHKISDNDIIVLQNSLRKCIPNPENHRNYVLEEFNMAISKVSIIQHGQEYHYANIEQAFIEISKIVNQVCSATNLNARSVLVEIPNVLPYEILDKNKYLAYLHEKQRKLREEEEERRRRQMQLRFQELRNTAVRLSQRYRLQQQKQAASHGHDHHHHHHHLETRHTTDISNRSSHTSSVLEYHHGGGQGGGGGAKHPGAQYSGRFIKYPIETSIRTKDGKKVVTYHDTGETFVYDDVSDAAKGRQQQRHGASGGAGHQPGGGLSSSRNFAKSTPNLADDNEGDDSNETTHFAARRRGSNSKKTQYDSLSKGSEIPCESYLRNRSQSVEDLSSKDKIDRYPSLLIEPGRKSVRRLDLSREWTDKWKKKAPQFWGKSQTVSKDSKDSKPELPPRTQVRKVENSSIKTTAPRSSSQETQATAVHALPSVPPRVSVVPPIPERQYRGLTPNLGRASDLGVNQHETARKRFSTVSNFSDISVSTLQQQEADIQFQQYYNDTTTSTTAAGVSSVTNTQQQRGSVRPQYTVPPPYQYNQSSQHPRLAVHHSILTPQHSLQPQSQHSSLSGFLASNSAAGGYPDGPGSECSSLLLDNSPSSTPEQIGRDTLDREFVYKAYPVNVREIN